MAHTDPIADMATRIRNALVIKRRKVDVPSSRMKREIARVLKEEGFLRDFDIFEVPTRRDGQHKIPWLRLHLKYTPAGVPVLRSITRVSKPGCRVFRKAGELPRVLDGLGTSVVSTSRGILSERGCRKQKTGGEVLLTVY